MEDIVAGRVLPAILLAAALGLLWWFIRGDHREYRLFKALGDSDARQTRYRLWIARAGLFFLIPSIVGLALLGRLDAFRTMPAEFAGVSGWIGPIGAGDGVLIGVAMGAGVAGTLIGTLWAARRARHGRRGPMLGDVGSLLPRNRAELPYTAALSVTAGVTEEAFFRLLLPLLIAILSGSAVVAFGIAALLFGAAHRYQGWTGVVATTIVGCFFTAMYLGTGHLWLAMALHVLVDLNGLVLRPIFTGAWRRV